MATVYAGNSGYVARYAYETWSTIRNNSTGTASSDTAYSHPGGVRVGHTSGRGSDLFQIFRSFFYFDTSGITGTLSDATLKIYGYYYGTADIIAVKSDAMGGDGGTALALTDYNNLDFSTAYSAELATWSTSGYNDITLNATALADMKNNDALIVCVIEYDHDYLDSAPSNMVNSTGMYYDANKYTVADPYIDYTVAASGYGNAVNGVAAASIGKVDGVATANIEKVIGV